MYRRSHEPHMCFCEAYPFSGLLLHWHAGYKLELLGNGRYQKTKWMIANDAPSSSFLKLNDGYRLIYISKEMNTLLVLGSYGH